MFYIGICFILTFTRINKTVINVGQTSGQDAHNKRNSNYSNLVLSITNQANNASQIKFPPRRMKNTHLCTASARHSIILLNPINRGN